MPTLLLMCPYCTAISPIRDCPAPAPGLAFPFVCPKDRRGCGEPFLAPLPFFEAPVQRVYIAAWKLDDPAAVALGNEGVDPQALFEAHLVERRLGDEETWFLAKPPEGTPLNGKLLLHLAYAAHAGTFWPHPSTPPVRFELT
jgi:hypothetical protein